MTESSGNSARKVVPLRRMDLAQEQLPLLPLRVEVDMPATFGSADLKTVVRTQDRQDYAIKTTKDHPLLPATEFLCYKIAAACNIPVPYSAIIDTADGEYAFGSRFEGGIADWTQLGPAQQFYAFNQAAEPISAILAFDLFVGNEDRHKGNFIFRQNSAKQWIPFGIDYSRAFLVQGFPNDLFPMPESMNTRITISGMKMRDLWKGPYAVDTIMSLQAVSKVHIDHWMKEMPSAWLPLTDRQRLLDWWQSPAFGTRVQQTLNLL